MEVEIVTTNTLSNLVPFVEVGLILGIIFGVAVAFGRLAFKLSPFVALAALLIYLFV